MKSSLHFFGIFLATTLFLAIELNNQTIFSHIYKVISPGTKSAQSAVENFFDNSIHSTRHYSKKIFDNSVPKVKDSVKSKMSGIIKSKNEPLDEIEDRDKEQLDQLIKSQK
jgi:hypothetical protein